MPGGAAQRSHIAERPRLTGKPAVCQRPMITLWHLQTVLGGPAAIVSSLSLHLNIGLRDPDQERLTPPGDCGNLRLMPMSD